MKNRWNLYCTKHNGYLREQDFVYLNINLPKDCIIPPRISSDPICFTTREIARHFRDLYYNTYKGKYMHCSCKIRVEKYYG